MQRYLALSIAVCLGFTSCQVFEKSEIWESVVHVTPGDSIRDPDPSAAYAAKLHHALLEQGAEHITYQYHYFTHQRDEAVDTRTAIVYRDPATPAYPWWLKDDRTATPVWLPNGDLDKQISFYIRRPAQVIEKKEYPAHGGSGKATLGMFRPATAKERPVFADHSQHAVTKIAQAKQPPTPATKPLVPFFSSSAKPVASTPPAPLTAVTKIQRPAKVAEAKPKPSSEAPAPIAANTRPSPSWVPQATVDPVAPSSVHASRDAKLEKLFRIHNGTSYDHESAMDRRKMEQLKQGVVWEEHSIKNAVDGFETRAL